MSDAEIIFAIIGIALTAFTLVATAVWAVGKIRADVKAQGGITEAKIAAAIAGLSSQFSADQQSQDQRFGEVGAAMRAYTAKVEREMHEIEIWGRDHFVLKEDFERTTELFRTDIRALGLEIKSDMKDLAKKIDSRG